MNKSNIEDKSKQIQNKERPNTTSNNKNQTNGIPFKCNHCYFKTGCYILTCSCLYCRDCLKVVFTSKLSNCRICGKNLDLKKTIDLTKKENLIKYSWLFTDQDVIMKKALESMTFQKNYQNKYIEYLKAKAEVAEKSNKRENSRNQTINDTTAAESHLGVTARLSTSSRNQIENLNISTIRQGKKIELDMDSSWNKDNQNRKYQPQKQSKNIVSEVR